MVKAQKARSRLKQAAQARRVPQRQEGRQPRVKAAPEQGRAGDAACCPPVGRWAVRLLRKNKRRRYVQPEGENLARKHG